LAYDGTGNFGNVFVHIAQAFGLGIDTFGDKGVGPLPGLLI
jgi:hypothetical protein